LVLGGMENWLKKQEIVSYELGDWSKITLLSSDFYLFLYIYLLRLKICGG